MSRKTPKMPIFLHFDREGSYYAHLQFLEQFYKVILNRERNMKEGRHDKVVVAIDEKCPIALDFMFSLAKRIRKHDGMLIIVTQNVKDFLGTSEIARKSTAIISAFQYSMVFSLPPNDVNDLMSLYENAGSFNEFEKGGA